MPTAVAVQMLELAGVTSEDVVYHLGSGGAEVIIAAARTYGARGVGVELEAGGVQASTERAASAGVGDRATFAWNDLSQVDFRAATVVTLHLFPDVNVQLRARLLTELRPGTRVVSREFDMADWAPDRVRRVRTPGRELPLYLWVVPAKVDGAWQLTIGASERRRAVFEQQFQRFTGSLTAGEREDRITNGAVRADVFAFSTGNVRYRGRISGDTAEGTVEREEGPEPRRIPWTATRDK
ncbi:MAG: class I SAM-dependent methyltransferase [Candidatus Rokubacteria bacterium]|nr:class I SAM-dependent methyltransferase [Candidatus Rokubacteria bacterium]